MSSNANRLPNARIDFRVPYARSHWPGVATIVLALAVGLWTWHDLRELTRARDALEAKLAAGQSAQRVGLRASVPSTLAEDKASVEEVDRARLILHKLAEIGRASCRERVCLAV